MAAPAAPYGMFLQGVLSGQYVYTTDTFKIMLTSATYVPNLSTHQYLSDITGEVVGTGYTAGGASLPGLAASYDATNNWFTLTAQPVIWSAATVTFRYAVIYKATGVPTTSPLIGYLDLGAVQTIVASDFGFSFPSGLIQLKP